MIQKIVLVLLMCVEAVIILPMIVIYKVFGIED